MRGFFLVGLVSWKQYRHPQELPGRKSNLTKMENSAEDGEGRHENA